MAHLASEPRCKAVSDDLVAMVQDCVGRRGVPGAARALGVGRSALLAVLAGRPVMPGTLALLREARARQGAGS